VEPRRSLYSGIVPDPRELPRPAHRVSIDLMGKRYALDVSIKELEKPKAEVVEMPRPPAGSKPPA
jgi:hypothetical protein